jgi:hypothetical protein
MRAGLWGARVSRTVRAAIAGGALVVAAVGVAVGLAWGGSSSLSKAEISADVRAALASTSTTTSTTTVVDTTTTTTVDLELATGIKRAMGDIRARIDLINFGRTGNLVDEVNTNAGDLLVEAKDLAHLTSPRSPGGKHLQLAATAANNAASAVFYASDWNAFDRNVEIVNTQFNDATTEIDTGIKVP